MNIPDQKNITLDDEIKNPTMSAISLVEAANITLKHLGTEMDTNELLGISSVAFSNYVYNPDYNQHEIPRRNHSPYTELISNYGIFESLTHYTGFSISEINGLSDDDIWKLIQFEILNNRPFILMDENFQVELVTGYEASTDKEGVEIRTLISKGQGVPMRQKLQGTDPVFVNWGVMTRPSGMNSDADNELVARTSLVRQQTNLLNWVVAHGFSRKEFFHETRENYACGFHGLEVLEARISEGLDAEDLEWFAGYISRLLLKRKAAAFCLRLWSAGIAEETDTEVEGLLRKAAQEYENLVALFSDDKELSALFPQAIQLEKSALSFIRKASQYFPSVFG